jgi:hypothetical protein
MSVCISSVFLLSLRQGWSLMQAILPTVSKFRSSRLFLLEKRPVDRIRKAEDEEEKIYYYYYYRYSFVLGLFSLYSFILLSYIFFLSYVSKFSNIRTFFSSLKINLFVKRISSLHFLSNFYLLLRFTTSFLPIPYCTYFWVPDSYLHTTSSQTAECIGQSSCGLASAILTLAVID